jgi:hypothetical protein
MRLNEKDWKIAHSVETAATLSFAWNYMTDVFNWDDPPARFELNGPFRDGTPGHTEIPGQPPRHWTLRDVNSLQSYTIQFRLEGATLEFEWQFKEIAPSGTRLTQCLSLKGEKASAFVADVQAAFSANLESGMNKIAAAIGASYQRHCGRSASERNG